MKTNMEMTKVLKQAIKMNNMNEVKKLGNELDLYLLTEVFETLDAPSRLVVFRMLNKNKALVLFEHLDVTLQTELIKSFKNNDAKEIFSALEPDDKLALMDELPATIAKQLVNTLSKEAREDVAILMGFEFGTVGRHMTPKYIRLTKEMTVEEAVKVIKAKGQSQEMIHHLFVTSNSRELEGILSLSDLVLADKADKIKDIMEKPEVFVYATEKDEVAAEKLQYADLLALPVVDSEKRLIGVLTVDDAMDILEEETVEQALSKAGFAESHKETTRSKVLTHGNLWQVWRVRVPYLMIALAGGLLAGFAIEQFEDSLEAVAALAFFIPVIMDMGGNVGTQSSTIFTRALIFGHINFKRFTKQWVREIMIGFTMGILAAVAAGVIVFVWQGDIRLTLTVSLALIATITIASTIGFLVPAVLSKLGFDQAAGSDPFITTIKDITGLLIYFILAAVIMGI